MGFELFYCLLVGSRWFLELLTNKFIKFNTKCIVTLHKKNNKKRIFEGLSTNKKNCRATTQILGKSLTFEGNFFSSLICFVFISSTRRVLRFLYFFNLIFLSCLSMSEFSFQAPVGYAINFTEAFR